MRPGQKVVIVDDLIATGGTTAAMIRLIERLGGKVVKIVFLMELSLKKSSPAADIFLFLDNPYFNIISLSRQLAKYFIFPGWAGKL